MSLMRIPNRGEMEPALRARQALSTHPLAGSGGRTTFKRDWGAGANGRMRCTPGAYLMVTLNSPSTSLARVKLSPEVLSFG